MPPHPAAIAIMANIICGSSMHTYKKPVDRAIHKDYIMLCLFYVGRKELDINLRPKLCGFIGRSFMLGV